MNRVVRGGLIQVKADISLDGTAEEIKRRMFEKHLPLIEEAARRGVQLLCLQELFNGPYFCAEQQPRWYEMVERIPDGPTIRLMQDLAKKHGMVIVVPIYEEEITGIYYNSAAVIDADGRYLGKYRKHHIPHVAPGFWEKFYFRPGNLGYPVFDTAAGKVGVYICYDRHFPEGARILGLNGAEIVLNPSATVAGLSEYLWKLEQPAHAVANGYFVGAINRVGVEAPWNIGEFYGQSYFCDPRGQIISIGSRDQRRARRRRSRSRAHSAGAQHLAVLPGSPPGNLRRHHCYMTPVETATPRSATVKTINNFIGGEWRESAGRRIPDLNPADATEVIGEAPASTAAEAASACDAAARAFEGWRATPAPKRGQLLYAAQRRMEVRRQELAEILTREEGKTIAESLGEIQRAINVIEFFAGEARRITGETIPSELPHNFCYTVKQPVGPVAVITPWNFPVAIPVWKIAPALVSGDTVVFKPASLTPLTAAVIVEIFAEAGLPPGVLEPGARRRTRSGRHHRPPSRDSGRVLYRLERCRNRPLWRRRGARHQVSVRDGRQEPDRHPRRR